jgi:hypothetical protein
MAERFTVTTNLKYEILVYKKSIDNALNYIGSTPNPCKTALEYAKHYKIVEENYELK